LLGPLQDNGGPTETRALLTASPAVDQGSCPGLSQDQRGKPRPVDQPAIPNASAGCDIGAFEAQLSCDPNGPFTVRIHVDEPRAKGQPGWLVRVYDGASGPEVASQVTDEQGDALFVLPVGRHRYTVEKDGLASKPRNFWSSKRKKTIRHRLSLLRIRVTSTSRRPRAGYFVTLYPERDGGGAAWSTQETDARGQTTFIVPDGRLSYVVGKDCYASHPANVTVPYGRPISRGHRALARVIIWVRDGTGQGHPRYLVRIRDDAGRLQKQRYSLGGGRTFFDLNVLESYTYEVQKGGSISDRLPVGGGVLCGPVEHEYLLATVTFHVQDRAGNPESGAHIYTFTSPLNRQIEHKITRQDGNAVFHMIEGWFQYRVQLGGYNSGRIPPEGIHIAPPPPPDDQMILHETR
jgi:hypothetical protein